MSDSWQFTATLPEYFEAKPLRQFLIQDWLLPKHLVFSLKRGQRILVNQRYLPVNFSVSAGDNIQLTFFCLMTLTVHTHWLIQIVRRPLAYSMNRKVCWW